MEFTDVLTIAMPCYERKDFFREALDSALNQTVKCKVIVIDNCSSHNYFELVCKEKGVKYYRNETNIGMSANFARGFELSETKYTMNLQDDDQLSPIYVESFLKALKEHPDLDVFFSDFIRDTSMGEKAHKHILPFGYMENGEKLIEYAIKYKFGFHYMASVFKKSIAHSYEDVKGCMGSYDWEWIYAKANNFSFYGDSRVLYQFRDHDQQDTKLQAIIYRLTLPFIYDTILKENVTNPKLKRKASKNAFWELVKLKSLASKSELKDFLSGDSRYNKYLITKLNENWLIRILFKMPTKLMNFVFKVSKRLGLWK